MPDIYFNFSQFPPFAKALKQAAPEHLKRAFGKALYLIGRSDIAKMKVEQLAGGSLNIRKKGFLNSFKFKATDSRKAKSIEQLQLSEYTGAKPFRIWQTGGTVTPMDSRTLTILTDAARNGSGGRKINQKELRAMIASGQAKIIDTKAGPCVIKIDSQVTKSGHPRKGAKSTILAWLKPSIKQRKRIDFFANFTNNEATHEAILGEAMAEAIEKTLAEDDADEFDD